MDLQGLIVAAGYVGLVAVIFAESGLLVGIVLPGDSVLFTAGFLASQGIFNVHLLAALCFVAAVAGDSVGYTFGRRVGRRLFTRPESWWLNPDHVARAEAFYLKHGGKTIILARFVPIVRTLAPILAGVGEMRYRTFLSYNVVGGLLWAAGVTYLGYFLGGFIPGVDRYLIAIVVCIVLLSLAPYAVDLLRKPERRRELAAQLRALARRTARRS